MDRNHNKYLDRWLWAMRQDPALIFQVAQRASLAVEYLLQIGHAAEKETLHEREDGGCRRSR